MTSLERMLARQIEHYKAELDSEGIDYAWVMKDYAGDTAATAYILRGLFGE